MKRLRFRLSLVLGLLLLGMYLAALISYPARSALSPDHPISLPILMYHSLMPQEENQYTVSPKRFEEDLIYLTKNGYTTVVTQDLIRYVQGKGELPEKPIMLTFDDGYYNNYYYALPLLKKYNCKIIFSPIGYCSDLFSERDSNHLAYSYVTWEQMREMDRSGLVEIANHSYDLHTVSRQRKGVLKSSGEAAAHYRELLFEDIGGMQWKFLAGIGHKPVTFTYPFGAFSRDTLPLLKEMGFQVTLTCTAYTNTITRDPDCLYDMGRYLRPNGVSSEDFFTKTLGFT